MLHCCAEMRPEKARRVITLHADMATQDRLLLWCQDKGFDLGWNYDGWPIAPELFRFHVTLIATSNEVEMEDRWQPIGPLSVTPAGFEVLGADRRVPVLRLADNETLTAMRQFFIATFGAVPTFADFKPHISLSYRWDGVPDLAGMDVPTFPLTFDALVTSIREPEKTAAKDAAMTTREFWITDTAAVAGTRKTKDGYLVADVRAARTGIQQYQGREVGRPDLPVVNVYRPPEEVFKRDSLASYGFKPVTVGHPQDGVSAANWKDLAVGQVGGDVVRDGGFVRVPLVLMDAQAIRHVEAGTREISMGYDVRLEFVDGVTPDGQPYQAIQRDIRINHAAIVERGRAGHECRIGDKGSPRSDVLRQPATHQGNDNMSNLRKIQVDGLTIETTDAGVEAIAKRDADIAAKDKLLADAKAALDKATETIKTMTADHAKALKDAEAKIPTADALEAMLSARGTIVDAAAKITGKDRDTFKGKSGPEVRRAVVSEKLGDAAVKDRSDDYVAAQFDTLAATAGNGGTADPVRDAFRGGITVTANDAEKARSEALEKQCNAWAA